MYVTAFLLISPAFGAFRTGQQVILVFVPIDDLDLYGLRRSVGRGFNFDFAKRAAADFGL